MFALTGEAAACEADVDNVDQQCRQVVGYSALSSVLVSSFFRHLQNVVHMFQESYINLLTCTAFRNYF